MNSRPLQGPCGTGHGSTEQPELLSAAGGGQTGQGLGKWKLSWEIVGCSVPWCWLNPGPHKYCSLFAGPGKWECWSRVPEEVELAEQPEGSIPCTAGDLWAMRSPSTGQAVLCIPDLPTLCLNSEQGARENPQCWASSLGVLQWIAESRLKKCVELELHLAGREQAVVRLGTGWVQLGPPAFCCQGWVPPLS